MTEEGDLVSVSEVEENTKILKKDFDSQVKNAVFAKKFLGGVMDFDEDMRDTLDELLDDEKSI